MLAEDTADDRQFAAPGARGRLSRADLYAGVGEATLRKLGGSLHEEDDFVFLHHFVDSTPELGRHASFKAMSSCKTSQLFLKTVHCNHPSTPDDKPHEVLQNSLDMRQAEDRHHSARSALVIASSQAENLSSDACPQKLAIPAM